MPDGGIRDASLREGYSDCRPELRQSDAVPTNNGRRVQRPHRQWRRRGANYNAQLSQCKAIFNQLARAFAQTGPYSVNSASGDIAIGSPQAAILAAQEFFARK